jgi:hypothetical protein
LITFEAEPGATGDAWFLSDQALYVTAKASGANRARGHERGLRIPLSTLSGFTAEWDGQSAACHLSYRAGDATEQLSATFYRKESELVSRLQVLTDAGSR